VIPGKCVTETDTWRGADAAQNLARNYGSVDHGMWHLKMDTCTDEADMQQSDMQQVAGTLLNGVRKRVSASLNLTYRDGQMHHRGDTQYRAFAALNVACGMPWGSGRYQLCTRITGMRPGQGGSVPRARPDGHGKGECPM
jgi:hypothetical protein